jgi:ribosomal protein S18 acetylase RimI-like enzyme
MVQPVGAAPAFVLRPVGEGDAEVLYQIYASTRADELAPVPWSEAQKSSFLREQFRLQCLDWGRTYPQADRRLILMDGQAVGRLYVDRGSSEVRVIDVALLPAFRGRGVGTRLLRQVLDEAHTSDRPVSIHVERANPALRLYQRLGFRLREDKGVYLLLECSPPSAAPAP